MDKENISKDIGSAASFEEELQLSAKEGGITVVDVYSTRWGHCKAIAPTFKRLYFDADEAMKLKFITVDATTCLQELRQHAMNETSPRLESRRPRITENIKDTLSDFWKPYFEKQNGHAKPLFMFYKEGKLVKTILGVNTPEMCETIKDLTTVKTPADEYISNPALLETWVEYFNPNESDVPWEKFLTALTVICKLTVPMIESEVGTVKQALGVDKERMVTAEKLQSWVGNGTVMQAFTTLLPNYEERAIQVRIEQEEQEAQRERELAQQRERRERELKEAESLSQEAALAAEEAAKQAAAEDPVEEEQDAVPSEPEPEEDVEEEVPEEAEEEDPGAALAVWFESAAKGDEVSIQQLLGAGMDVDAADAGNKNWTALHYAAMGSHVGVISVLMNAGATPNVKDAEARPPIFVAQEAGQMAAVQALIDFGVNF